MRTFPCPAMPDRWQTVDVVDRTVAGLTALPTGRAAASRPPHLLPAAHAAKVPLELLEAADQLLAWQVQPFGNGLHRLLYRTRRRFCVDTTPAMTMLSTGVGAPGAVMPGL